MLLYVCLCVGAVTMSVRLNLRVCVLGRVYWGGLCPCARLTVCQTRVYVRLR